MPSDYYYHGDGEQRPDPKLRQVDTQAMRSGEGYRAGTGLKAAVDVALRLGMPLLVTGEPGIGKSRLADSIAWEFGLGEVLSFVVKSDTQGKDLFYQFDTVGRFHAANVEQDIDPRRFISFNALGKALLFTHDAASLQPILGHAFDNLDHPGRPRQSVVLIDEIDKAPRDLPNDLLSEIDTQQFRINEITGREAGRDGSTAEFGINPEATELRPIIIITSNSEKALPDAFMRRCIYYHMPFPHFQGDPELQAGEITVESIVAARLLDRNESNKPLSADAVSFFRHVREQVDGRKPGLAELLNWLEYLFLLDNKKAARLGDIKLDDLVNSIQVALLKNKDEQQKAHDLFKDWQK